MRSRAFLSDTRARRLLFVGLGVAVFLVYRDPAHAADTPVDKDSLDKASVIVKRIERQCFSNLLNMTGYVVPRASAVVMFNAPNFRITEVFAHEGDAIKRGDRVATAVGAAGAGGPGTPASTVPVRSFASGTVIKTAMTVGAVTGAKTEPLATLAIDGVLDVAADVPNVHVQDIRVGQPANVTTPDGTVLKGRVTAVPVTIDRKTQFGQARIAFDGASARDIAQFVRVRIETSRSCGAAIPRTALLPSSEGPRVLVVNNETVETRRVRLGLTDDTNVEATGGLSMGELVVANAGASLRDGDRVKAIFADLQDAR